ncbi:glycine/sarcosine/betaine reductase complex component C subunit alpha [Lutispora thermophila]|uniref:Fatty acid synthesis protein n=1 Tax=Lutispora thermophila DSM 19022 TaxID=1122184 RepID=A0A1M6H9R4_9FIRM|nr:glycine/sarcosine/betaine reductase complex component C subunit alpha [Lutispora thermophila]SHJ18951.1 Fatty acid synthesis protein [Lutispora thermophila DSM 19022]
MEDIRAMIGEVFNEVADAILTGNFGSKVKVGLTTLGSEHGTDELVKGAELAAKKYNDFEIVLIGPKVDTSLNIVEVNSEEDMHKKMDEMLESGELDAAVTMHYSFPIGVSTVGRVITPGLGKELILATTTGTSSTHRVEGMVKNALYGIITAKALGIENPTVGILNVDGARQVERALKELKERGYDINFSESVRSDGGCIMRGNDLLAAASDVMVMDTLTGNIMMKVFSAFTTGGSYESLGYGYGPGVGDGYDKIICILSRASGAPVVCEALRYAASCAKGNLTKIAKEEFDKARKAGLDDILNELKKEAKKSEPAKVKMPDKKVVTKSIAGIDILELENAVATLAGAGIYSESGMGCTGPIILTADEDYEKAVEVLFDNKLITQKPLDCNC